MSSPKSIENKVLYKLTSGATLIISPPTLALRNALLLESVRLYPDPDEKEYERPTQTPLIGGGFATTSGRDSDEFKHVRAMTDLHRSRHLEAVLLKACVDTESDRAELVESYRRELSELRLYTDTVPDDDWEAVLKCFLAEADEMNAVRKILSRNLPLSEEDTADGRKFFRVVLSRDELRALLAGKQPPADLAAQPRPDQRTAGGTGSSQRVGNRARRK